MKRIIVPVCRLYQPLVFLGAALAICAPVASALTRSHMPSSAWRPVTTYARRGTVEARVNYQVSTSNGIATYRRVVVSVMRGDRERFNYIVRRPSFVGLPPKLILEDIWGSAVSEVLVTFSTGGQGCCSITVVGILTLTGARFIVHNFGQGWRGQMNSDGHLDFVARDERFACVFASCASSALPIQVMTIDHTGRRLIDVTRSRRRIVAKQAVAIWRSYVIDRLHPSAGGKSEGDIAAWCADQYLLSRRRACEIELQVAVARGYLGRGVTQSFSKLVRDRLIEWGYSSSS